VEGVFIEDQARVLSERFDVLVFAQRTYGWRQVVSSRVPSKGGFAMREGVRLYEQRIFLPHRPPIRAAIAYQLRLARRAMAAVAHGWGTPDLIHAHVVLPSGWIAARLGHELEVPVVLTEHTGPFSAHLTSVSRRSLVKEALRSSAKVLAVSPALARQIEQVDPLVPIEVVGDVIPTRLFQPADSAQTARAEGAPLRLFSVSLLVREKGHEHLLRAARMLLDNNFHPFELRIGGDGPDRRRLEALIRNLRLEDQCSLLGMLKRDEVRDWMQWCDIFVLPSLAETFGVVIGEAMACGKPVLATHCGGADFQVTPDTGMLVAPGDANALAEGIRNLAATRWAYSPARIRNAVTARFGERAFLESLTQKYREAASSYAGPLGSNIISGSGGWG
jgi:glycosyltransferase involved in cell wall biosynthesis